MARKSSGTPGSHPHSDRPNWQPAESIVNYLQNCREGLETYSERRAAKLLGWSRVKLWRVQQAQKLPDDLFDRLLKAVPGKLPSWRELASIAQALYGEGKRTEIEQCPCCGHVLRVRAKWRASLTGVVDTWIREQRGEEHPHGW